MAANVMPDTLGVFAKDRRVFLFYHLDQDPKDFFRINQGEDGFYFADFYAQAAIFNTRRQPEDITQCRDFRVSRFKEGYFLTYRRQDKKLLCSAVSKDLIIWKQGGVLPGQGEVGMLAPDFLYRGQKVFYFGEKKVQLALSADLKEWSVVKKPIWEPLVDSSGSAVKIGGLFSTEAGLVLVYFLCSGKGVQARYFLKAILLDRKKPTRLLWTKSRLIWQQTSEWKNREIIPVGTVFANCELISYWQSRDDKLFALSHPYFEDLVKKTEPKRVFFHPLVEKFKENPLLAPIADHFWESRAVFNPAVVSFGGKVHIFYRAVGEKNTSVLGYAASKDGRMIDQRLDYPVYAPNRDFEGYFSVAPTALSWRYHSGGGGWAGGGGGCEDPRLTKIGDRLYMIYVAYDGMTEPRLALTSISEEDFLAHRWNWKPPVLISQPGVIDKSGVLLPEKVNGQYLIFHRVFPDVLVSFVDDLDDFDGETKWLSGQPAISPREGCWDSRKVGMGATPIKTDEGWLVIYHGVDDREDGHYQIGAMLLDKDDPTQVLYRPLNSILEPNEVYENRGLKSGVVYPCGAATVDEELLIYYGGSDQFVCLAHTPLRPFLEKIKSSGASRLAPVMA